MAKTPKRPRDPNQLAKLIVDIATGGSEKPPLLIEAQRKGGLKGGPSRAAKLTDRRRSEIATQAAEARWGKKS